ncbi:hypothetical protein [Erysipelatoclostridium sp. An173]|uniref:hypothetical protein n=1 Tax=Erysipelatoclostridium sp. An173 TaxID=1965571 RepID=UPI00320B84B1
MYVSSDCNDLPTYIPFMEKYYQAYGEYPEKTPADAGYGSYDNYMFCKKHEIDLYMKYSGYYKEQEKRQKRINSGYLKCGRKMEVMCVHYKCQYNFVQK